MFVNSLCVPSVTTLPFLYTPLVKMESSLSQSESQNVRAAKGWLAMFAGESIFLKVTANAQIANMRSRLVTKNSKFLDLNLKNCLITVMTRIQFLISMTI